MHLASSVKTIDALRRGLEVLRAVEQSSAATMTELHLQTRIPKASLLRILKTLHASGWIARNEVEGRYVPVAAPGASNGALHWRTQLSALAAQHRVALQRRIPWPIDLAVRDGDAMLILDAHRPINGLAVNYRVLGFRPGMLMSSLGRCYLAFCDDDERRDIVAALSRSTRQADRSALRADVLRRMVVHGRSQGYCARDPSATSADSPERFGAISVPVFGADTLAACLSLAWLPAVTSEREIVSAYLVTLKDAATAIGARLRQHGLPRAPVP